MKKLLLLLVFIGTTIIGAVSFDTRYFDKVVIWGHKPLHSHTHSYIHYSFDRTFRALGYDTYWLGPNDDVSDMDFANTLFIVSGDDANIPLRADCRYVLHNCGDKKYTWLHDLGNCLILQVYVHKCKTAQVIKIDEYVYFDPVQRCLYQPWATDLLPHEIDAIKEQMKICPVQKENAVYMAASIGRGDVFENWSNHEPFRRACADAGIAWRNVGKISMEENIALVQRSLIAPAIQSKWQCQEGYIPCRIFKNISYGQMGITNSLTIYELFDKKIVYNPDTYQLLHDAIIRSQTISLEEQFELMDFVRDNHTYINRIHAILAMLDRIKPLSARTHLPIAPK